VATLTHKASTRTANDIDQPEADRHGISFGLKAEPITKPFAWLDRTEVRQLQGR